ncbi:MAG: hypothetical protein KGL50_09715, partial [Burkholderiales bacterium]|nr:hypothetical protein [Burkholderiales bacterium]
MSPRGAIRALACGLALTALAAGVARAAPAPAAAELDAPHAVAAPFYGATLFDFYQDHPYAALTGLMVSQHFQRLAPQADEAEVLRGGLLLDYGMPQAAEAVFARLIDGHASAALRDRAWYFLARSQHERGADGQARQSLARIAAPLPGPLQAERLLLQAQLLMAGGDDAAAAALLDDVAADPQARPATLAYARFNLGVALLRQGEPRRGEAQLDALGRLPATDEELRSLRDRANLALGFAALQAGQPVQARAALQRVRLDGAASDKALLGYGWAAAQLHDPQLALTPWQTLAARPGSEAAVLEARIAVPYALSQLGAWGGALQGYRDAAGGFEREQQALAQAIAAVRAGALVQGLLQANPGLDGSELGRRGALATLPVLPALPPGQAQALVPLLAGHEFQQGLRNLRDLQFLGTRLARWQQSLDSFDDMLATRRRAYAERLPAVREQAGRADLAALA